ncbi:hypothetical protein B296_00013342 [Ensete ventricosum]|uniref:Uncharacterized protein n=1 Tax=Ensete ventricosum TaxID=4639 RepID=A0A427A5Q0_ENSVE|nr:hypothetical protein B296_00013342 [Ensete ventricosum]
MCASSPSWTGSEAVRSPSRVGSSGGRSVLILGQLSWRQVGSSLISTSGRLPWRQGLYLERVMVELGTLECVMGELSTSDLVMAELSTSDFVVV